MATKKKFSMTQPKSAAAAYIEAQEKKEEKEKTPKKQTTQNKEQLKGTPKAQKPQKNEKKSTLSEKDREMMKTDFDPPKETNAKKKGQPRKYEGELSRISFALPVAVVENLKALAGIKKTNQTQIILRLIEDESEREKENIKKYNQMFS